MCIHLQSRLPLTRNDWKSNHMIWLIKTGNSNSTVECKVLISLYFIPHTSSSSILLYFYYSSFVWTVKNIALPRFSSCEARGRCFERSVNLIGKELNRRRTGATCFSYEYDKNGGKCCSLQRVDHHFTNLRPESRIKTALLTLVRCRL